MGVPKGFGAILAMGGIGAVVKPADGVGAEALPKVVADLVTGVLLRKPAAPAVARASTGFDAVDSNSTAAPTESKAPMGLFAVDAEEIP